MRLSTLQIGQFEQRNRIRPSYPFTNYSFSGFLLMSRLSASKRSANMRKRCAPSPCSAIASIDETYRQEQGGIHSIMPEKETLERAKKDEQEGKSPSTQAGEFVREEMHHIREGKHGARSTKQAVAIGLSKARRAGVKMGAPKKGTASAEVRQKAQRDLRTGQSSRKRTPSRTRARATSRALKREGRSAASPQNLARQARTSARRRGAASRHQAAIKAVQTKGKAGLKRAAQKAAETRASERKAA
jgi:hypothetical protein